MHILYILSFFFAQVSLNPIRILKNEAEEEKAEIARMSSFIGAIAIGDLVKSTLGPKGMDKILVSMGRNSGQVCCHFFLFCSKGDLFMFVLLHKINLEFRQA